MKRAALIFAVLALVLPMQAVASQPTQTSSRQCGSFKYGTDGYRPGPSGIRATNVGCWFARAIALLGAAPGWHCALVPGHLLFSCKHGDARVTFWGE